jgi:hypothetical protein
MKFVTAARDSDIGVLLKREGVILPEAEATCARVTALLGVGLAEALGPAASPVPPHPVRVTAEVTPRTTRAMTLLRVARVEKGRAGQDGGSLLARGMKWGAVSQAVGRTRSRRVTG